ncbi:MAG: DUF1624 domain-containing protein [Candidatus Hydrogenedentes bacterium]|nr:DUF1624 domain-containing protein [Candidatus Hydrogenedentota bacterium]
MAEQAGLEGCGRAAPGACCGAGRSGIDAVPKRGHRIVGIDMARSLAIFLMVIENYKNAMEAHGPGPCWLVWFFSRMEGRAAPAFVTIMGAGLALLARNALASGDPAPRRDSVARIVKRGVFLVAVGVFHYQFWPGDILHFYGFYMVLCALFLFRPSWTPLAGAALVLIVAYAINQVFDDEVGWENGHIWYNGYLTPSGFVRNTFLNGYHPVFPWAAYVLVGMWLAQRPIFDKAGRRRYLLVFLPITLLFEFAMSADGFLRFLYRPDTGVALADGMLRLLVVDPRLLFMVARALVAISAILVCLELADRFRKSRVIETLATTGRMSLTHYLAHTFLVLGPMFVLGILQQSRMTSFLIACGFFAAAVTFSALYSRRFKLGPLEAVMRRVAG